MQTAWPDPVPAAAVAETHTAVLFFVGDRVYKQKRLRHGDVLADVAFLETASRAANPANMLT